jgi:hypothetical protein
LILKASSALSLSHCINDRNNDRLGGLSIKSAANYFATARRVGMRVALGFSRGSGLAITR